MITLKVTYTEMSYLRATLVKDQHEMIKAFPWRKDIPITEIQYHQSEMKKAKVDKKGKYRDPMSDLDCCNTMLDRIRNKEQDIQDRLDKGSKLKT